MCMSTHNPFNIFHTLRCKWCALRALTYVHSSTLTDLQNPARRYTLDIHVITCYLIYCIQSPIMLPSRPLVQSIDDDDDLTAEMLRCNLRYCVAAVQHSVNQSVYCYHKTTAAKYFWCGVLIYFVQLCGRTILTNSQHWLHVAGWYFVGVEVDSVCVQVIDVYACCFTESQSNGQVENGKERLLRRC